jgi:hypothetical protein
MGGSQMGRIAEELQKMGQEKLEVVGRVNTKGRVDVVEISNALQEVAMRDVEPEKIVVNGPGNCLMEHGDPNNRGFKPQVTVKKEVERVDRNGM